MAYKTILVNAEAARRAPYIAACAARVALAEQAHLVGLASTGINPLMYQCNAVAPGVVLRQEELDSLTASARQALAAFTATASGLGVLSSEERLTNDALPDSLIRQSRYSDLVVLGQTDPGEAAPLPGETLPQQVILHCPRPVLVVPHAGDIERIGERPLLAWDGGMAASRALLAALPLLRRATLSTLAIFNPVQVYDAHGQLAGADMATCLARHGVKLDVVARDTDGDVGEALLTLAADIGADLLVMGCYGHTRLREMLLGGATRSVLRSMTLPVLMTA
jgi:nucleotide-binding universal stress UspA family protein